MTFSSAPSPVPAARPAHCDQCGTGLRPEARFCGGCGSPIVTEFMCAACGATNPAHQRFCDQCGCDRTTNSGPAAGRRVVTPPTPETSRPPASTPPNGPSNESLGDLAAPSAHRSWPQVSIGNGRYRIEKFLGEGAAKQVFRAHDELLDRDVAVSVISTASLDETGAERARREAQAMARLGANHHIVTVFDIGEEGNDLFVVSELMMGGDLAGRIDAAPNRQLQVSDVVAIGLQLADALDFVHGHGIVHRDVKPQNIWIGTDGTVKLGDFGLAVDSGRSRLTTNGMMVGTVAYMPPEQALGHEVDPRSDLYSLGAVLYEMVCGVPPFEGELATGVISQHVSTPVTAPRARRPGVPAQLDQLVVRLLAKDPAERPRSGAEVKASLEAIAGALDAPASAARTGADRLTEVGFVGRDQELDRLRAAVDDALSSRGRIILVGGEDGVGKTRLVAEAASYATLRGAQVVWGRCVDDPGAPAYWPWVQAIRALLHERDDASLVSDLGLGAVDVGEIVSDVRARLPNLPEPPALEPEQARFRLFDSVSTFLLNAARRESTVIVLDDLHAADQSSLRLLEFLAGHVGAARILVMATARDAELGDADPLTKTLTTLGRERSFDRLRLSGLDLADIRQLFEHTVGPSAGGRGEDALVEAVFAESEGNPFFAGEIIRHVLASGRVRSLDSGRWTTDLTDLREVGTPEGMRDAIMRRVDVLSGECRGLLQTASVFGRSFDAQSLALVVDPDEGAVRALLDEAVAAGVTAAAEGAGAYRFEHAAIRDTLYEQLQPTRRSELHRLAGEAIEELREDVIEAHLGELAHHFVQAARGDETEETAAKAADYAWWAGERAVQKHAYEEAAMRFEQALSLIPDNADQAPRRCELLVALGDARWRIGDRAQARATFLDAAKLTRRAGLDDAFARAALGYGGGAGGGVALSDRVDETLVRLLREGLSRLSERDSVLRVELQGRLAVELVHSDSSRDERIALAEDTVKMAERIGEPRHRLIALYSRQSADVGPDDVRGQLARADDIVRLATAVDDGEMQFRAREFRYSALLQLGDTTAAARELAALEQLAAELRQPYFDWQLGVLQCGWALKEANLERAEQMIAATVELGRRNDEGLAINAFAAQMFMLLWAREGVESLIDGVVQQANSYDRSAWPAGVALVYAECGRLEEARGKVQAMASDDFAAVQVDRNWMGAMSLLALAASEADEPDVAEGVYQRLVAYADQHATILGGTLYLGSNHFFLGIAARTAGRLAEAIEHLTRARQANDRAGERVITPRLCRELARSLLDRGLPGDSERARQEIEHGLATAQATGMQRHVEDLLKLRLDSEGVEGISTEGSIFLVARSVRSGRPDLTPVAAPDGTVTIMFSDIQDSTLLTDRLGDRRWMELLRDHNAIVTRAVEAHSGFEVKAQGDGYMLAFDSARRALKCAIDTQRDLARYRAAHPESPLHVRIGLHTGEVIRDADDFFGRNVILAARIAASAGGDEILASSVLRELAFSSGEVEFGDHRDIELKGLSGVHRVYTVPY